MKTSKNYFSGFCFCDEQELFSEYLIVNDFTVSGFSYGAIKAFEYVLNSNLRVDLLQLFSPAFFQNKDEKFKRTQLMYFKKDEEPYIKTFLGNVNSSFDKDVSMYYKKGNLQELEELINYEWKQEKLQKVLDKGVKTEVYLGEKDKIIDAPKAKEFFKNFATVYYFKDKGHLL